VNLKIEAAGHHLDRVAGRRSMAHRPSLAFVSLALLVMALFAGGASPANAGTTTPGLIRATEQPDTGDCSFEEITFLGGYPTVSGTFAVGSTVSTTNGSWSSCGTPLTGYNYQWLKDGLAIANATSSTYVIQPVDVGHVIVSSVAACNADGCYSPKIESSNALDSPVISASNSNYFTVANHDGFFTIFKACLGQNWHRQATGNPNDNRTVGPGYIAKFTRFNGDGTRTAVIDDERPPDYAYGGLGTFGFHAARLTPQAPPYTSPLTGRTEPSFDNPHSFAIEGRECAYDDPIGLGPQGIGVGTVSIVQPESLSGGIVSFAIDVYFRDGFEAADLVKVRYRYRFRDSQVQVWTTVTEQSPYAPSDNADIKENKFEFNVSGGGYTRETMIDTNEAVAANGYSNIPYCSWMGSDPTASTGQCDNDIRYRARYDYAVSNETQTNHPSPNCIYATDTCLNIIGRAVSPVDTPGAATSVWEKSGYGLDAWAAGEPLLRDQSISGIAKFATQDGPMGAGTQPWWCNTQWGQVPSNEKLRRWELNGGAKSGGAYVNAKMDMHGWEGGSGGTDCELLSFNDNRVGVNWGSYFSISLGPGYTAS